MSCNNVQILNFNHNIVEIGPDNKIVITDQVKCNSITIPQPVTNILQINSPGPQGPAGPSGSQGPAGPSIDISSFVTTSSFNNYTGSNISQFAGTSSYATTASYALFAANGGGSSAKASSGSVASFSGSPFTTSITLLSPFSNDQYSVAVSGKDARIFTVESQTPSSFIINTNSSVALTGPVYWIATSFN